MLKKAGEKFELVKSRHLGVSWPLPGMRRRFSLGLTQGIAVTE